MNSITGEGAIAPVEVDRQHEAGSEAPLPGKRDRPSGTAPMIEISDDDYRSVHLPCEALEETAERNPRR